MNLLLMVAATEGGGKAAPVPGPELLTNGDMSSATGWLFTNPAGAGTAAISGGKLNLADPQGFQVDGHQNITVTAGLTYRVAYTIDSISGGHVNASIGGTAGASGSVPGTYTADLVAITTAGFYVICSDSNPTVIDNASCKLLS